MKKSLTVCLSPQMWKKIDARATKFGESRSGQIARDLEVLWALESRIDEKEEMKQ